MLLNAGASAININIVSGDQSLFTRDISIGGNAYTEAVQKELNLPFDAPSSSRRASRSTGVTFEEVQPVLHAMTENVLLEIQKTFDFFKATAASDRIDRIVLSGGASRVDGFARGASGAVRIGRRVVRSVPKIAFEPCEVRRDRSRERPADGGGRRRARAQKERATDDSHQPARRRTRARSKKKAAVTFARPVRS